MANATLRAIDPPAQGVTCIREGRRQGPMTSKKTGLPRYAAAATWIGDAGLDA